MMQQLERVPPISSAAAEDVVDLWYFRYEASQSDELLQAYAALLTPDERERHDRFLFAKDRLQFLATRALVRTVLSEYAEVAPADWRFSAGSHGRPYVTSPAPNPVRFNLSNTQGLVVCAVTRADHELGVDVEFLERRGELVTIASDFFSPIEVEALRMLPAEAQRERFFAYWTLKESYIKARGLGLAIPLDQFSFVLEPASLSVRDAAAHVDIRIAFDPRLDDAPLAWSFALLSTTSNHMLAVAAKSSRRVMQLRATEYVPLRGKIASAPARG
jgi:4'-phosphopantetheinyl transferase